jgi:hypothetical protein
MRSSLCDVPTAISRKPELKREGPLPLQARTDRKLFRLAATVLERGDTIFVALEVHRFTG